MTKLYLSLGSNLGDREQHLLDAVRKIEERIGSIVSLSSFYDTDPWGFASAHRFLNAALCAETSLSPEEVLLQTQAIERELGRTHKSVNGAYQDRVIDIDLLLYGELVVDTPLLRLPHPLMCQRSFVMQPLAEIAPDVVHPLYKKTVRELAKQ
jgi:2-amino-4-hydroxy-6-hydroxymethyldihydropteridine diphosphokinase